MDLALQLRVIWRFRFLVLAGVILALVLAFLAFMRVSISDGSAHFSYRGTEKYESKAILLITQSGFPWGRSVTDQPQVVGGTSAVIQKPPRFADSSRFSGLAPLYAALAVSDPVQAILRQEGPLDGKVAASPVLNSETVDSDLRSQLRNVDTLPLLRVTAETDSAATAKNLVARQIDAFRTYLEEQQQASRVPPRQRVEVSVLRQPEDAELAKKRSVLYPVLILVGVIGATVLLAFVLENLKPRNRLAASDGRDETSTIHPSRRSA